jgi:hypothetical protein
LAVENNHQKTLRYLIFQGLDPQVVRDWKPFTQLKKVRELARLAQRSRYLIAWGTNMPTSCLTNN